MINREKNKRTLEFLHVQRYEPMELFGLPVKRKYSNPISQKFFMLCCLYLPAVFLQKQYFLYT